MIIQKPKIAEKYTEKLKKQLDENQKNTKTEISTKLVPVSTSRLPGWIHPFPSLVTAWEQGGLAHVVIDMFVVRMSRSQRQEVVEEEELLCMRATEGEKCAACEKLDFAVRKHSKRSSSVAEFWPKR